MQFVFKYIDPKDEEKPFVFTVAITAQKKYSGNALVHMLQVTLNFQANSFRNQVIFFQIRSTCFDLDQFGAGKKHRSQAPSFRSLFTNTESILNIQRS